MGSLSYGTASSSRDAGQRRFLLLAEQTQALHRIKQLQGPYRPHWRLYLKKCSRKGIQVSIFLIGCQQMPVFATNFSLFVPQECSTISVRGKKDVQHLNSIRKLTLSKV
jgi:hypothetical protein